MVRAAKLRPEQPNIGHGRPGPRGGGLPAPLRSGIESLSGVSMDDVQVHRQSSLPARFGARALAQGNQIHLGPDGERSLPHEAWHVVQQRQGRVRPDFELDGSAVNASATLEREADTMGRRALAGDGLRRSRPPVRSIFAPPAAGVMQMDWYEKVGSEVILRKGTKPGGYRMVKGALAPDGKSKVFETAEQRSLTVVKPLTYAEQLGTLPPKDDTTTVFTLKAGLVRFSQDSIAKTFSDGKTIDDTVIGLKSGTVKVTAFDPIRVVWSSGDRLVTLDNRRLWCCKEAGVDVRCVWASEEQIKKDSFKFTSNQGALGLTTITVRD